MTINKLVAGQKGSPTNSNGGQIRDTVNGLISVMMPAESIGVVAGVESATTLSDHTGSILFDSGEYLVTSWNFSNSNVVIQGSASGETILANNTTGRVINFTGNVSNVTFKDITFKSSAINAVNNFYGVITSDNATLHSIKFINCKFTCPSQYTGGVKIICEDAARVSNLIFRDCEFYSIGGMGLEVQNHTADTVGRYHGVFIENCIFKDTGLISPNGMGVSLSGYGAFGEISNSYFSENKLASIELVGASDITIRRNKFKSVSSGNNVFSISGNRAMKNNSITENTTEGTFIGGSIIRTQSNLTFNSNQLAISGFMSFRDVNLSSFRDNVFKTADIYSMYFEDSADNLIDRCILDNSSSLVSSSVLRFYGAGSTRNIASWCRLIRGGSSGVVCDQISSATNNFVTELLTSSGVRSPILTAISVPDSDYNVSTTIDGIRIPVIFRFNGSNTAPRLITMPNYPDGVFIYNNTGNSLTFKGTTGGVTPALANQDRKVFIFDGNNAQLF